MIISELVHLALDGIEFDLLIQLGFARDWTEALVSVDVLSRPL